jgi:hypothetical protein
MKKLFTFIAICFTSASLLAQTYEYRSEQNPYYWKNRMPNAAYWQQDVHYKIKATLNDETEIIDANEELTYYNNSPDTLSFVYFHLYQNAFIKGAYLENLNLANNFNVSVPYMQIKNIRLRDSKFGKALVIETHQRAGGYVLGFKVDSEEKLNDMFREITNIYQTCSTSPVFGVDFVVESEAPSIQELLVARVEEDVEIVDDIEDAHAVAAYYADGNMNTDDILIEYDPVLGLAVESTGENVTLENLWRVY